MTKDADLFKPVPFGRTMRDTHFLFAPEYTPLNHGSYGTYPRAVQKRLREYQALAESRPDWFMKNEAPRLLAPSRAAVASLVNAPADEIVLVPNASTGTNVVLRSLNFVEGDILIYLSVAYGAVQKTLAYLEESTQVRAVKILVQYPTSDDNVVEAVRNAIQTAKKEGLRVRAVLFDTISSMPGVRNPWQRLVQLCREEDVLSVVDGAHGVGQIPIDLSKIKPDFFVSNLHKWLFNPRGSAVFYVPKRNQHLIRSSLPTSHGFAPLSQDGTAGEIFNPLPSGDERAFVRLFDFVATIDASPYFCVETALRFRTEACGGEQKIMKYCQQISDEGGRQAAEILGTEVMKDFDSDTSSIRSAFSNVRLPLTVGDDTGQISEENAFKVIGWISDKLLEEHDVFVNICLHAGSIWARFSGQIYLEVEDFVKGARALKILCEAVSGGHGM